MQGRLFYKRFVAFSFIHRLSQFWYFKSSSLKNQALMRCNSYISELTLISFSQELTLRPYLNPGVFAVLF